MILIRRATIMLTIVTAVWFSAASPPASAQLTATGPAASQTMHWYEQHIPLRFQARTPLLLRTLTDSAMNAVLQNAKTTDDPISGEVDGLYEDQPPHILFRLPASGRLDYFTLAHEYGHYVWDNLLNGADRRRYEAIYNQQRIAHHLVTRYASTDVIEGFAEAFSFYANEPPLLRYRDFLSYQFLNSWTGKPPVSRP